MGNQTFSSIEEAIDHVKTLQPADRYDMQCELRGQILEQTEAIDLSIEAFYNWVKEDEAWKVSVDEAEFAKQWAGVKVIAVRVEKRRNRITEARKRVATKWTEEQAEALWRYVGSDNTARAVSLLAATYTYTEAVDRINAAIVMRLGRRAPGVKSTKDVTRSDIEKASRKSAVLDGYEKGVLTALGVHIDRATGLIVEGPIGSVTEEIAEGEHGATATLVDEARDQSGADTANLDPGPTYATRDATEGASDYQPRPSEDGNSREETLGSDVQMGEGSEEISESGARDIPGDGRPRQPRDDFMSVVELSEDDLDDVDQTLLPGDVDSDGDENEGVGNDDDYDDDAASDAGEEEDRVTCRCHPAIPQSLRNQLSDTTPANDKILGKYLTVWHSHRSKDEAMCFAHRKILASKIGLLTRALNTATMDTALVKCWENRAALGDLRAGPEAHKLFRVDRRPWLPVDSLGVYRFKHEPASTHEGTGAEDSEGKCWEEVMSFVSGSDGKEAIRKFNDDGTINLEGVFSWFWEQSITDPNIDTSCNSIGKILDLEFDMYRYHLRRGKKDWGWLRTMVHSVTQQIIRQDPVYYMAYVALRPDHQSNLIAYPYYTKYAKPGDSSFFRHIDVNIERCAYEGHGAMMVQGSVSLDDEDEDNCTVVLPGMHRRLKDWAERLAKRGHSSKAYVERISPYMFTEEDASRYGISWTPVPTSRGAVRITMPGIPHGSTGPSTRVRRTILPWFVGLQKDLETLEIAEGGTWEDLSKAHRDLTAGPATPSGLANRYGPIPYAFPAAVPVMGISAVSDALVGRRRWSDPLVIMEKRGLLFGGAVAREAYVTTWRRKALNQAVGAFLCVRKMEKEVFGEKSFFLAKENGRLDEDGNEQDADVADDCGESFVHGLEPEYTEGQNTATADSKTRSATSSW